MSVLKQKINGTARESVADAEYSPGRTDGITRPPAEAKGAARAAERYSSGTVEGVNVRDGGKKHR